jgi:uncharacterized protein (DUF1330 family)
MPKGYWIAHITVNDAEAYQAYRNAVPGILAAHGGTFVVRAGTQTIVDCPPAHSGHRVSVNSSSP